jgi:hypothetical protein
MRVPSRGSATSLLSRFGARNYGMDWPKEAVYFVHPIDRGSASVLM